MYKMSGLNNYGTTCYVNTVVQLLRYCKPVVEKLIDETPDDAITCQFINLLYKGANVDMFLGHLRALGFCPHVQQDASEFFLCVLDRIYDHVDQPNPFKGEMKSTLTCKHGHTSVTTQPFLTLPINGGVTEGLKELTNPEVVQCKCESCDETTMTRTLSIHPGTAVCFHVKRFDATEKLNYKVPVLQEWGEYDLVGIANHMGRLHGGHYVATVKTKKGWKNIDDEHVSSARIPEESELPYMFIYNK